MIVTESGKFKYSFIGLFFLSLTGKRRELEKELFGGIIKTPDGAKINRINKLNDTCFVCESIENGFKSIVNNTLKHYENEREFRKLFDEQETFCLPHYALLMSAADKGLSRRYKDEFKKSLNEIVKKNMAELHKDVRHFCDMYDYRNNGEEADWGNSRDSLERSVNFITSRDPEKK